MMLRKVLHRAWAPALLLVSAAACRSDETHPSGSGQTPLAPSPGAVQGGPTEGAEAAGEGEAAGRAGARAVESGTPAAGTPPSVTTAPSASAPAGHTGTPMPTTASSELAGSLTDGQIAAITDGLNAAEIEQAKVARSKSKHKGVLGFAGMMIEHHGQAQKQQAALKETSEPSPLANQLKEVAQQTLTRLNQANDADFDRAYLDAQVEGHQKALDTLKNQLLPSAKTPELAKYLRALQPRIEQHLARARTLRDGLASDSSSNATRPASVRQETTSPAPNSAPR